VQQPFDFDLLCRLAQEDPAAFEGQRHILFEQALAEMPSQHQNAARTRLAEVQVRMAAARDPADRLAIAASAMSEALFELQRGVAALCDMLPTAALHAGGKLPGAREVHIRF
jgi:hypothetical protein